MKMRYRFAMCAFAVSVCCACTSGEPGLLSSGHEGQRLRLVVSANDGKQLERGQGPQDRTADSVAVIDFTRYPPKTLGTVLAPAGLIGPPVSVAVSIDQKLALVTATVQ